MLRKDVENLLQNHKRRLQKLREQQALLGFDTPPQTLIEMEDIEAEVETLEEKLNVSKDSETTAASTGPGIILDQLKTIETKINSLQQTLEMVGKGEDKEPAMPPELEHLPSPPIPVDALPRVGLPHHIKLTDQEIALLQYVHRGYGEVLLEKEFDGGYGGTRVLLVLPVAIDKRMAAYKVTKLGPAAELRRERDNYRQYVGNDLPFCVAQVREYHQQADRAALNYVFVGGGALGRAVNLEEYWRTHPAEQVNQSLSQLLDGELGPTWYGQPKPLTCLFKAEYGRHLVEHEKLESILTIVWPDLAGVDEKRLQLPDVPATYPHPLQEYTGLLGKVLKGRQSYVHGDLHLRNILVDELGMGRLIDFAKVEERHNLFDFIKLETYVRLWMLANVTPPLSLAHYLQFEAALNDATLEKENGVVCPQNNSDLQFAYQVILAARRIARKYMGPNPDFRNEYFPALFLYCLAVMKYHENDGPQAARLTFATACELGRYIRGEDESIKENVALPQENPANQASSLTPHGNFTQGHALLIGVGADLPVTAQDATALHELLIDPHRAAYPQTQVELLTETTATCQNILAAFDRLAERVNASTEATVIVYFSGHGGRLEHPEKPDEYYLVPFGYDPGRRADTAISGLEFTKKIEALKVRKLVVLLDCCHAGGVPALKEPGAVFVKSPTPPELLEMLETGSGRVVIASSHEHELSYTGTAYSVFTACLLEALAGRAAVNKDGFARILDVLIYLFDQVPARVSGPQHPFVKKVLDLGDNFPLCYYAGGEKQASGQDSTVEPAPASTGLTARQRQRMKQKHAGLQQEWQLRSEKVERMRKELATQTSVAVIFQLEQQLLDEEARLAWLDDKLDEFERLLE